MELNTRDFLMKALLQEQEMVRDYQRFAQQTDDQEAAQIFRQWAEDDGLRANKIKHLIEKYDQG